MSLDNKTLEELNEILAKERKSALLWSIAAITISAAVVAFNIAVYLMKHPSNLIA